MVKTILDIILFFSGHWTISGVPGHYLQHDNLPGPRRLLRLQCQEPGRLQGESWVCEYWPGQHLFMRTIGHYISTFRNKYLSKGWCYCMIIIFKKLGGFNIVLNKIIGWHDYCGKDLENVVVHKRRTIFGENVGPLSILHSGWIKLALIFLLSFDLVLMLGMHSVLRVLYFFVGES